MIGDGCITKYQISVTLDRLTDSKFCEYVASLIGRLFDVRVSIRDRPNRGCVVIVVSSIAVVDFLTSNGLSIGNKIRAGVDIPRWISDNSVFAKACIRGIFDTDGCIYLETHRLGSGVYRYPRMAIVSASANLRYPLNLIMRDMGLSSKIRNNRSVTIERFTDIEEYFKMVGSSNPKHIGRFTAFGGVG